MDKDDYSKSVVTTNTEVILKNTDREKPCCSPETENTAKEPSQETDIYKSGCAVCGLPLIYFWENKESTCYFCGQVLQANAGCPEGHFVCGHCHTADAIEIIRNVCLHSQQTDVVDLM